MNKILSCAAMLLISFASQGAAHATKDLSMPAARKLLETKLGPGWKITNLQHAQRSWVTPHANTKGFVFEGQKSSGPVRLKLGKLSPTGRITFDKLNGKSPDEQ